MEKRAGRYHDLIDRIDGFTIGTLIIDGSNVTLETKDGFELPLETARSIEILNGSDYVSVTLEQCRSTFVKGTDDWPLFAGFYTRVLF